MAMDLRNFKHTNMNYIMPDGFTFIIKTNGIYK